MSATATSTRVGWATVTVTVPENEWGKSCCSDHKTPAQELDKRVWALSNLAKAFRYLEDMGWTGKRYDRSYQYTSPTSTEETLLGNFENARQMTNVIGYDHFCFKPEGDA